MEPVAEALYNYLSDIMFEPARAALNVSALPDEFRELAQGLQFLAQCLTETRTFAQSIARGDLSAELPSVENEIAAPLKALHATLKHLTWQTQQIAKGDYRQHVDCLGDFAVALNMMTKQLEQRNAALESEIARSRQKTRDLEEANDLFELVTRESAQWICVVEKSSGEWLYSNRPIAGILADDEFLPQLRRWMSRQVADSEIEIKPKTTDIKLESRGIVQFFAAQVRQMMWRERASVAFVLNDISDEREHLRELEDSAYRDSLTRQYNRFYGMRLFEQWVREKRRFAMSFVDIDNLKYVNDKFGHLEGDRYILSVAAVLRGFSPDVTVCRIGGDEFMLLAEDWSRERAVTHLEGLRARLLKRNDDPSALYYHSMSYGVVAVDETNDKSPSELLTLADSEMYAFKLANKSKTLLR